MEAYRSGHNGTDSKSVVPHGTVGSNPTASAKQKGALGALFCLVEAVGNEESHLLRSKIGFGFEPKPSGSSLTSGAAKKSRQRRVSHIN